MFGYLLSQASYVFSKIFNGNEKINNKNFQNILKNRKFSEILRSKLELFPNITEKIEELLI